MIYPFLNMTIKGAIWYQGESNAGEDSIVMALTAKMFVWHTNTLTL